MTRLHSCTGDHSSARPRSAVWPRRWQIAPGAEGQCRLRQPIWAPRLSHLYVDSPADGRHVVLAPPPRAPRSGEMMLLDRPCEAATALSLPYHSPKAVRNRRGRSIWSGIPPATLHPITLWQISGQCLRVPSAQPAEHRGPRSSTALRLPAGRCVAWHAGPAPRSQRTGPRRRATAPRRRITNSARFPVCVRSRGHRAVRECRDRALCRLGW